MGFEDCIASDVVTVIVGKEGMNQKTFYINQDFIAEQSPPLRALIAGNMKESKEKKVVFAEVDPRTFVSFAQWAMTGRYEISLQQRDEHDGIRRALPETSVAAKKDDSSPPRKGLVQWLNSMETMRPFNEDLLQHAQIYVFGDIYDIPTLRDVAFHKLTNLLDRSVVEGTSAIEALSELVRYVYGHTMDDSKEQGLRQMVTKYCARNIRELVLSKQFAVLQAEGGPFPVDLMNLVLELHVVEPVQLDVTRTPSPKKKKFHKQRQTPAIAGQTSWAYEQLSKDHFLYTS